MRLGGISSWSMQLILSIFLRYLRTASRHTDVNALGFPAHRQATVMTMKMKTRYQLRFHYNNIIINQGLKMQFVVKYCFLM